VYVITCGTFVRWLIVFVLGYRWPFEVPKILHRDISLNNLMLRKEGDKVYGVLNDLDLAISADIKSTSSKQRTGTKPFMAIDLLPPDPLVHVYRHDLESMFYVLVWITSRFHDGEEIADAPLQEWADQGGATLVDKKHSFILSEPPPPTSEFDLFGRWVVSLQKMMRNGFSARTEYRSELAIAVRSKTTYPPTFDDETLDGFVTFDMFEAILDAKLL
jgi:serine/threonine protein kinase